jgi:Domain of unknown function (DUF5600)
MRLPSVSAERKVNAVVKRVRLIKVHICILGHLRQKMPKLFGHARARLGLLQNLEHIFDSVRNQYKLSEGDMPDVQDFRERLSAFEDFRVFPFMDVQDLENLEDILTTALPQVMCKTSQTEQAKAEEIHTAVPERNNDAQGADKVAPQIVKISTTVSYMKLLLDGWIVAIQILTNLIFLGAIIFVGATYGLRVNFA